MKKLLIHKDPYQPSDGIVRCNNVLQLTIIMGFVGLVSWK
jgi:hypothetical protein